MTLQHTQLFVQAPKTLMVDSDPLKDPIFIPIQDYSVADIDLMYYLKCALVDISILHPRYVAKRNDEVYDDILLTLCQYFFQDKGTDAVMARRHQCIETLASSETKSLSSLKSERAKLWKR